MHPFKKMILSLNNDARQVCQFRYLSSVQVTAVFPQVITLQYIDSTNAGFNQMWTANGSGEVVTHTFEVVKCVDESSVFVDEGTIIDKVWQDGINCCLV